MRLILFSTLFLFIAAAGQAQFGSSTFAGPEHKSVKGTLLNSVVGYDNSGIYTLRSSKDGPILAKMNHALHPMHHALLELKNGKSKTYLELARLYNRRIWAFTSSYVKSENQFKLFVQTLNTTTLVSNNDARLLYSFPIESVGKKGNIDVVISPDSSKVLLYHYIDAATAKDKKSYLYVEVLDQNLNKLWGKSISDFKGEIGFNEYLVDNSGNAFALSKVEPSKGDKDGKVSFDILAFLKNGTAVKTFPLNLSNQDVHDAKMTVTKQGKLVCSGFYSDYNSSYVKGVYNVSINIEDGSVTVRDKKDFSLDFITQNMTEKAEEKTEKKAEKGKNVELYSYAINRMLNHDNGFTTMIAEQYYVKSVTTTGTDSRGNTYTRTTNYFYNRDMILVNFNTEGKIVSLVNVPKYQVSTNSDLYSSFTAMTQNNKTYLMYNDHVDNLTIISGPNSKNGLEKAEFVRPVMVEVSQDGKVKKEFIDLKMDLGKGGVFLIPKISMNLSQKEKLLYFKRSRNEQFVILKY